MFYYRFSVVTLIIVQVIILGDVDLFLSEYTRLEADEITAYLGLKVGFFMYLCLKDTVPYTLGVCVYFTHRFQHR